MTEIDATLDAYERGPALLRAAVERADPMRLDERPIPGRWSIREVVGHLADTEIVYADRMKRVLAEDDPTFFGADPDQFRQALRMADRDLETELAVVATVRRHVASILRAVDASAFQRTGRHASAGPMTLRALLQTITEHLPHHLRSIDEKIAAMNGDRP